MEFGVAAVVLITVVVVGIYLFGTVQGRALFAKGLEYAKGLYAKAKGTR